MSDFIEIHWTAGSIDEARKVCRFLVQARLVASAQIIPWIESIYQVDNQVETTQETKVILRTRSFKYEKVQDTILKNSTYEVPEISSFPIGQINHAYSAWLEESLPL